MRYNRREIDLWFRSHCNPRRWFPFMNWLPNYKKEYVQCDILAGFTVGMLLVPQSLAVASLVGVPSEYGLYSSFIGSLVNVFFGTCKDANIGPSVLVAVMTARFNHYNSPNVCSLIGFFSGLVLILSALVGMGFMMNFVSYPVLTSFISVAAFTIASTQLPVMFGIRLANAAEKSLYEVIFEFFFNIRDTIVSDLIVGALTCITAIIFSLIFKHYVIPRMQIASYGVGMRVLWFVCLARSAWLTILGGVVGLIFNSYFPNVQLTLTGKVSSGLPIPEFPVTSTIAVENGTIDLYSILKEIYPSMYLVPLICAIEHLSVVRSFSKTSGYNSDLTQELFNLGIINTLNSLFQGFPISGSLSRAAVNSLCNVCTPISGLIGSLMVLLAMKFLTPLFEFIPKGSLAGIIIAAVLPIMDLRFIRDIYLVNKFEAVPCVVTLLVGFYRMEFGMLIGVMIAAGFIMFRELRPRFHHLHEEDFATSFHIRGGIHFPGAEFFSRKIIEIKANHPQTKEIDIDCCGFYEMDYTVAMELKEAIMMLKSKGVNVRLVRVKQKGGVRSILQAIGLGEYICQNTLQSEPRLRRLTKTSSIRNSPISLHSAHFTKLTSPGINEATIQEENLDPISERPSSAIMKFESDLSTDSFSQSSSSGSYCHNSSNCIIVPEFEKRDNKKNPEFGSM